MELRLPSARLDGQHAVVTGGGRGIGRAAALALAESGASVTLAARSVPELEGVAWEARSLGTNAWIHPTDVTQEDEVQELVAVADARAPVSLLVTAAGVNRTGATTEYSMSDWDRLMAVNVRGTFLACRAVGQRLSERGDGGRIILVSSQMGSVGYPGRAAYCATKHAVNGLTKALAVEWAARGVTVNAVAPTFVRTTLIEAMLDDPAFKQDVLRRLPVGAVGDVQDVAGAITFLASDRARLITGHVLAVDGGWTAW